MIKSTWIKVNENYAYLCVGGTNEYLHRLKVETYDNSTTYVLFEELVIMATNNGYPKPHNLVFELNAKDCKPYFGESDKTKITDGKVEELAQKYDIETAAIRAVLEVESSNDGFLEDGRPKILFEGQWFGKFTNDRFTESHPDISALTWSEARKHYKGGAAEYDRLDKAINLNPEAAYKSASWGLPQIMGFNYKDCDFDNVFDFVKAMHESADRQLEVMFTFLNKQGLVTMLRQHRWTDFAYHYNGSGYAQNNYHLKLETAYAKWKV